jgi:hypothetical protein
MRQLFTWKLSANGVVLAFQQVGQADTQHKAAE